MAAYTKSQAFSALLFLYREVLECELPWLDDVTRERKPNCLTLVLSVTEVVKPLRQLPGTKWLMASLLYGFGLRLLECLRLRVRDMDFEGRKITVRCGRVGKDRVTVLPWYVTEPLESQIEQVRFIHEEDISEGFRAVYLRFALEIKYSPGRQSPRVTVSVSR